MLQAKLALQKSLENTPMGKQRGGEIPSVLLWEVWNEKLNLQVQVQDMSSTSTQNPNVFQMSLGFK